MNDYNTVPQPDVHVVLDHVQAPHVLAAMEAALRHGQWAPDAHETVTSLAMFIRHNLAVESGTSVRPAA